MSLRSTPGCGLACLRHVGVGFKNPTSTIINRQSRAIDRNQPSYRQHHPVLHGCLDVARTASVSECAGRASLRAATALSGVEHRQPKRRRANACRRTPHICRIFRRPESDGIPARGAVLNTRLRSGMRVQNSKIQHQQSSIVNPVAVFPWIGRDGCPQPSGRRRCQSGQMDRMFQGIQG